MEPLLSKLRPSSLHDFYSLQSCFILFFDKIITASIFNPRILMGVVIARIHNIDDYLRKISRDEIGKNAIREKKIGTFLGTRVEFSRGINKVSVGCIAWAAPSRFGEFLWIQETLSTSVVARQSAKYWRRNVTPPSDEDFTVSSCFLSLIFSFF